MKKKQYTAPCTTVMTVDLNEPILKFSNAQEYEGDTPGDIIHIDESQSDATYGEIEVD